MEEITRLDIQRDGLNQAQPLASARSAAEQRAKEYRAHLKRLEWDEDYAEECRIKELEYQATLNKHNI